MEAQECVVATKLSYVLLPNSIGKTTLDCKNIVVDNDHDEKASASLFSKIMKEIQSFVPEKETERYSAVLYKDKEQKICVDTPEKFTKEIVKDYNKKQPLRQLKYVTSKLEHLKYQLHYLHLYQQFLNVLKVFSLFLSLNRLVQDEFHPR